jgi:hypothetical protein
VEGCQFGHTRGAGDPDELLIGRLRGVIEVIDPVPVQARESARALFAASPAAPAFWVEDPGTLSSKLQSFPSGGLDLTPPLEHDRSTQRRLGE